MNDRVLEIVIRARDEATKILGTIGKSVSEQTQRTNGLVNVFGRISKEVSPALKELRNVMLGVSAAVGIGIKTSIDAANQFDKALIGLASVAGKKLGEDAIPKAKNAAIALAEDGLMTVSDAAEGLKNLLATGFSLPQAIQLMNAFKDSAAFNRQGMLGFGEAIVGATGGIKNQNSVMVDNVGIGKNLSIILKEQGLSVDALGEVTSDASTRLKLFNGLMQEASLFSGDAAKLTDTYSGATSVLGANIDSIRVKVGQVMQEALKPWIDNINNMITQMGGADGISQKVKQFVDAASEIGAKIKPGVDDIAKAFGALSVQFDALMDGESGVLIKNLGTWLASEPLKLAFQGMAWAINTYAEGLKQLDAVLESLSQRGFIKTSNIVTDSIFQQIDKKLGIDKLGKAIRGYADGGFVPSTGLAMVHAGEFVLSRDMLAGRQSVPNNVNTYNSPVTVNATISSPADINVIANRIAWAVRNSR